MKNCEFCNKSFKIVNKSNANRFCSYDCYYKARWPIRSRKYLKIEGSWYKGRCEKCQTPIKGSDAKLCHYCYWLDKSNPVIVSGVPIKHYHKAHYWIKKKLGQPSVCEDCGFTSKNSRQFHWANISHDYLLELHDWKRLCVSCHIKLDRIGGAL